MSNLVLDGAVSPDGEVGQYDFPIFSMFVTWRW